MAELHWFPAYVSDWLGSPAISMMLPEQEGAYWRLLNLAWGNGDAEPSLPDDDAALSQMSRLGSRWKRLGALVRGQFVAREGRLYNEKLSAVWKEQQGKHETAVKRASAGGKAKAVKQRATSTASSTAQALLDGCSNGAELELDRELETDLEELSVNPPPAESALHALLDTDADRVALTAIILRARSREACGIALASMLSGNDPAVPKPTTAHFGQALRDFAANGAEWNAAHFRGYLDRATGPKRVHTPGSPSRQSGDMQRAVVILQLAKEYDLLSWNGNAAEYQRRQASAAADERAGPRFLEEIKPLKLAKGIGDQKSDHFAAVEIATRMAANAGKVA